MPAEVQWSRPAGGFFIWLQLPKTLLARQVQTRALQEGVAVTLGEDFFVDPREGLHCLRLAYSYAPVAEIEEGIHRLAQVILSLQAA